MNLKAKQLSSPFSTGGGGGNFETRVQAAFTVLLLTGGFAPCRPLWPIKKLKLQGHYAGFDTDDLIVFRQNPNGMEEAKLLVQAKHSINITETDNTFREVIQDAWNDFNDPEVFKAPNDSIALVTGPLNRTDMEVRTILEWARNSEDAEDFVSKVLQAKFSSKTKKKKLKAFQGQLKIANSGNALTEEELWKFLKSYHLLGYDLDVQSGVIHSLLHSLICQKTAGDAKAIWACVVDEVQTANQNSGVVTAEALSQDLREYFQQKVVTTRPSTLSQTPPSPIAADWNRSQYARSLAIANLLGGWDENKESDRNAAEQLVDEGSFSQWIIGIRELLQEPGSPLALRNGVWKTKDKRELWRKLGQRIFDADIDGFRQIAVSVLSEHDSTLELAPDEKIASWFDEGGLTYSDTLRKGLSDTLALLAIESTALSNCSPNKSENTAILVVRELLGNAGWVRWGSLGDLLPILAEADPKGFLDAVEDSLQRTPCPMNILFSQEGNGITGGDHSAGLLRALESLAWDQEHLCAAVAVLGRLNDVASEYSTSNRPADSLTQILLPWLPQTTANIEKRKNAIHILRKETPDTAWPVLLSLLPDQCETSFGTHKPIWRQTIPKNQGKDISREEYWDQVSFCANQAVEMAAGNVARLVKLVSLMDTLPPAAQENLLAHLRSGEITELSKDDRTHLWSALTRVMVRYRHHSDADWSLGAAITKKIEEAIKFLAPKDLLNLNYRFFSSDDFDSYEETGSWEEHEKRLKEHRQDAIRDIHESGGHKLVARFARSVDMPYYVGVEFDAIANDEDEMAILPCLLSDKDQKMAQFVAGFIGARHRTYGWSWVNQIDMSQWSVSQKGHFLRCLPFVPETWELVSSLLGQQESEYWGKVAAQPFLSGREIGTAVDKLLQYDRPNAAIDCLSAALRKENVFERERTVKALLCAASLKKSLDTMNVRHAIHLIKALQNDSHSDLEVLSEIEWAYLSLLNRNRQASPKILEQRLASDPQFFCEIIRAIYRSNNEDVVHKETTKREKDIARCALRLLHKWRTPPGLLPGGELSPELLQSWLDTVKSECKRSGHLEFALSQIGGVLVYAPPNPKGFGIHEAVAEILNAEDAKQMRRGYYIGAYNSRGGHWVDPTGKPERELEAKYTRQADEAESHGFHRLASMLRDLAESYSREAARIASENSPEEDL